MITIKTNLLEKVVYTLEEFKAEVIGMIEFSVKEKEYALADLCVDMIAEDITGVFGDHQMPKEGLDIIERELNAF